MVRMRPPAYNATVPSVLCDVISAVAEFMVRMRPSVQSQTTKASSSAKSGSKMNAVPFVFDGIYSATGKRSEHPRGMPLVARIQGLQA
jgi:hypothetical protein